MIGWGTCLHMHDALILLRNSFSIPKLLHILRTSPAFLSPALATYDESLQSIVSSITNIQFEPDDPAWTQATLPIGVGGLGIRSAVQLAPSALLASAAATHDLVCQILPPRSLLSMRRMPSLYGLVAITSHLLVLPPVFRSLGMLPWCQMQWISFCRMPPMMLLVRDCWQFQLRSLEHG